MVSHASPHGRLGRDRWNAIEDAAVKRALAFRKLVVQELMVDGTPPLTEPLNPYMQYLKLQAMAIAGSPDYTRDAAAKLAQLAQRFGQPQPFEQPFGRTLPNNPQQQSRLAEQAQSAMQKGPIQIFPGEPQPNG